MSRMRKESRLNIPSGGGSCGRPRSGILQSPATSIVPAKSTLLSICHITISLVVLGLEVVAEWALSSWTRPVNWQRLNQGDKTMIAMSSSFGKIYWNRYLSENNLVQCWVVQGEKSIIGGGTERVYEGRNTVTAVYRHTGSVPGGEYCV